MTAREHGEQGAGGANLGGLPISSGDVLLKKYRVERLIGEGGTGIVISATHMQLEQRVAIKFLRRALESDELRTRFEREARAMGKIESDHVVLVLDAGALDDGAPYMVMEYLEGRDLARVLKEDGPLPVEQAVDCMLQVCEALQQAHDNGIVHRDLKPANLFLTWQEDDHVHVKVVDFGISKIFDKKLTEGAPHEVTSAFTVLGSPRYMAPEQVRNSKDVDGRADLWSVGAVLFQLITGKHAFAAEGNVQASLAVLTADPQSLRAFAPHVPAGLEAVVRRCLTRDVARRFQSASELAEALRPFASDRAKESLDRIHSLEHGPSLKIALSVSSTSAPPPPNPSELPTGTRDIPTERRIRLQPISSDPRIPAFAHHAAAATAPSDVPVMRTADSAPPSSSSSTTTSKLLLGAVGLGAVIVVLGGIVALKRVSAPSSASAPNRAIATTAARLTGETAKGGSPIGAQPRGAAPAAAASAPAHAVMLDAGRASP